MLYAHMLTNEGSGVDATSYAFVTNDTSSVTNGTLLLLSVENTAATAATPTVTGWGLTWVQVDSKLSPASAPQQRLTVFRAMGTPSSNTGITVDFAGATQTGCTITIDELFGTDTSGTNGSGAIVQEVNNSGTSTAPAATLSALSAPENGVWMALCKNGSVVPSANTGYLPCNFGSHTSPSQSILTIWRPSNDTAPAATSLSTDWATIAIEIKAGSGPVVPPFVVVDFYDNTGGSSANHATTLKWSPQVGDLILIHFGSSAALSTVTPPSGFSTRGTVDDVLVPHNGGHYEKYSAGNETTLTMTNSAVANNMVVVVARCPYGRIKSGSEFHTSTTFDPAGAGTTGQPGSHTPTVFGEFLFATTFVPSAISAQTVDSGYTVLRVPSTQRQVITWKCKSFTDKTAENPTMSWTTSRNFCMIHTSYKAQFPVSVTPRPMQSVRRSAIF